MEAKVPLLIVDDRPENLLALEAVLRSPDYEIVRAESGPEALSYLRRNDFALVLMDVQMPGMDGFETVFLMRRDSRTKDVPVIFVTANLEDEKLSSMGYEAGAVDYIYKPLNPEILRSKVSVFVELYKRRKESDMLRQEEKVAILENAMDAVVGMDAAGNVTYWNRQAELTFRWARSEVMGKRMSELIIPERLREKHERGLRKFLTTGEGPILNRRIEITAIRKGGEEFPVELTVSPLRGHGGGYTFSAFIRDISERLENETRLRLIAEGVKDFAIITIDEAGSIVSWSDGAEQILGYPEKEIKGKPLSLFFTEDDIRNGIPRLEMETALEKGYAEDERWHVRKDGVRIWASGMLTPLWDRDHTLKGYSKVFRDRTETKIMRDRLQESEQEFLTLANSIPQLAWMANADGSRAWSNQQWYDYTGMRPEEVQGFGWKKVHHPDHLDRVMAKMKESCARGDPWEDIFPLRSKTGEWRWFLTRARPMKDAEGKTVKYFGTNTDITDELATRAELEKTIKARDEFVSIASHELKTPLTSLKLQAQMARNKFRGQGGEAFQKFAGQIDRGIERLTRLVDDMLDITRISTGRLASKIETVDLALLTGEVLERMRPLLKQASCELVFREEPNLTGHWDRLRVEQIVTNLVSNASRYGAGRPIEVTVKREGEWAQLIVRDYGRGIQESDLERIFQRFERAIPYSEVSGLGLGLYIVRQIVELHKGRIDVQSRPGDGSSFIVSLPLGSTLRCSLDKDAV